VAKTVTVGSAPYVGTNPEGVAISPNGAQAYVTNSGTNSVSVISTAPKAVFSVVDVSILIIVIVIVVILIILAWYKRSKKKTQQTQAT
jgi:YVTN family beta-propeller protein